MSVEYTRDKLHKAVWSKPMQKLALELGISDRGLTKICKKYHIPVPGLGYWAKKQAGHGVMQVALPKLKLHNPEQIIFTARTQFQTDDSCSDNVNETIAALDIKDVIKKVSVDGPLQSVLAQKIEESLTDKCDKKGIVKTKRGYADCIKVTIESRKRVLYVLDAILSTLENMNIEIKLTSGNALQVNVFDELFIVQLDEKLGYKFKKGTSGDSQVWVAHPTGKLRVKFDSQFEGRTFYDTAKHKRLEKSIKSMMVFLLKASDNNKRKRKEAELERLRREEEHRLCEQEWNAKQLERRRVSAIEKTAKEWSKIKQIERFIKEARDSVSLYNLSPERFEYCTSILSWTERFVAANHPLQILVRNKTDFE